MVRTGKLAPLPNPRPEYPNQLPSELDTELIEADQCGFVYAAAPSEAFNQLIATSEWPLLYVVVAGELRVAERETYGLPVRHSMLSRGEPVQAAGEVSVVAGTDFRLVLQIDNRSGHYRPLPESLAIAVEAFVHAGFDVPEQALDPYTGG